VEHACYRCGAIVNEGAPFCPECRAPQIRVNVPEPDPQNAPATPPFPPGTPGELQPPAVPVLLPSPIRLRDTLGTALAASAVIVAFWVLIPAGLILGATLAGALAVLLYARRRPEIRLTAGSGAKIGMMSGLAAFAFFFVVILVGYLADHGASFRQMLEQWLNSRPADNPARAEILSRLNSPEFMATVVVMTIIFMLIMLVGFSSIGGAIAAWLMRRKEPR
jgi:hypothetical protein